jgi:hypothetical protein
MFTNVPTRFILSVLRQAQIGHPAGYEPEPMLTKHKAALLLDTESGSLV